MWLQPYSTTVFNRFRVVVARHGLLTTLRRSYCIHKNDFQKKVSLSYNTTTLIRSYPLKSTHHHVRYCSSVRDDDDDDDGKSHSYSMSSLVAALPIPWRHYAHLMRADKPIGTMLLYWPCTWSIALAADAGALPDLRLLALFGTGAFIMRGAGCTINDLWDKDIDSKVERTQSRPLASGVLSKKQAVGFLALQLSAGLGVLLQLNPYSIVLGMASMGPVIVYPLMKRVTNWPQVMLGLAFNWGALLGWSAVHGSVDISVVGPLYLSGISWTLFYDTIYAHQDKRDDSLIGLGSTALRFGENTPIWLGGFATITTAGLALAGIGAEASWPYFFAVALSSGHLSWQLRSVEYNNPKSCMRTFIANSYFGAIIFAGCIAGRLFA